MKPVPVVPVSSVGPVGSSLSGCLFVMSESRDDKHQHFLISYLIDDAMLSVQSS